MAIVDANRARKTYSFFRAPPAETPSTLVSGSNGVTVTGDRSQVTISTADLTATSLGIKNNWRIERFIQFSVTNSLTPIGAGASLAMTASNATSINQSASCLVGQIVPTAELPRGLVVQPARVSAANTVVWRIDNVTTASLNLPAETWVGWAFNLGTST